MIKGSDDIYAEERVYENFPDFLKPPLKQIQSGIPNDEVMCNDDLVLTQKYNGSPACVILDSIPKLIERKWIESIDTENMGGRNTGYILLHVLYQYADHDQVISIDFEGPQNYVNQIIESYDIRIMSSKTTSDGSFSSNFGNITKANLEFFLINILKVICPNTML